MHSIAWLGLAWLGLAWLGLAGTVEWAALGRTIARIIGSSSVIAPRLSVVTNEPT